MQVLIISFLLISYLLLAVVGFWLLLMSLESNGLISYKRYRFLVSRIDSVVSVLCGFIVFIAFMVAGLLLYHLISWGFLC